MQVGIEVVEHVVQVGGLDTGLDVNIPAYRIVFVSAVAANAGVHFLALLRIEPVILIGLRVGFHVGFVMAAVRFLVAVRFGSSALCLGIIHGLGVGFFMIVRFHAFRVGTCSLCLGVRAA